MLLFRSILYVDDINPTHYVIGLGKYGYESILLVLKRREKRSVLLFSPNIMKKNKYLKLF